MRRMTLAMTLGLGLAFAGCGPTADPAAEPAASVPKKIPVDVTEKPAPKDAGKGAMAPAGGGGADRGGTPDAVIKGMQSPEYRNQPGSEGPGQPKKGADDKKPGDADKPAGDKKDQVKLSDEELKNIKTLPEADQKLALAQMTCPVGGEPDKPNHLGAMGTPVKQVVKGKTVFLCCESCIEDLKKDPDKYLSKLAK